MVLTFEGQANTQYASPINRSGVSIGNVAGDEQHFHEILSSSFGLVDNGTGVLHNDRASRLFMELAVPGTFTLTSFDISTPFQSNGNRLVTLEGFLGGISTGTITTFALNSGYTTVSGTTLGLVDRLVFGPASGVGNGGFNLDNVALDIGGAAAAAPELGHKPFLPILSAVILLGLGRRRAHKPVVHD